ncbi:hypothetical protein [Arachidicoccus terrestris]|uniref:hypothetical protein n=1 Tax=Arachidicoccus terrestris TaxID=2875539 RepID=UPI001CC75062|nr:hypothetical protein [Arachidicoccus terrestris]UAY54543.1 hypothetical protein K9M52_13945 [Arachidicoccus terrestris]
MNKNTVKPGGKIPLFSIFGKGKGLEIFKGKKQAINLTSGDFSSDFSEIPGRGHELSRKCKKNNFVAIIFTVDLLLLTRN